MCSSVSFVFLRSQIANFEQASEELTKKKILVYSCVICHLRVLLFLQGVLHHLLHGSVLLLLRVVLQAVLRAVLPAVLLRSVLSALLSAALLSAAVLPGTVLSCSVLSALRIELLTDRSAGRQSASNTTLLARISKCNDLLCRSAMHCRFRF